MAIDLVATVLKVAPGDVTADITSIDPKPEP